jgi:autophagy-related protein 11
MCVVLMKRSSADVQAVQGLSSQLRLAEREKAEQAQQLAVLENAHDARVREMTDLHDQRTTTLQTRQAELQDELMRLRTDLSEEMVARQALSTQLEEQAREQDDRQREYEDQAELLVAVQAELVQEQDRATDLGVRLQEALLDVDGHKNAEQALISQVTTLQEERSRNMRLLGEAHNEQQSLESQIAGLRAELEATSTQLGEARVERDGALRSQHAEAERMMRDHIAEADGDRAVLEHQNLTLTKQLEDLRVASDEKLGAAKNAAIREVGGLQAELKLTKAQLRDVQRRETILADELAMAKDSASTMRSEQGYQSDVSRDAVALVSKYHEACQRLQTLINNSSTISGTASTFVQKPMTTVQAISQGEDMRESVLVKSLEGASAFDLAGFSDAVQKTIGLVKKWSRSCKTYRDTAKHKISFANFTKGDLVSW